LAKAISVLLLFNPRAKACLPARQARGNSPKGHGNSAAMNSSQACPGWLRRGWISSVSNAFVNYL
jgi:hypothetical protein